MSNLSHYKEETLGRFINSRPDFEWDFGILTKHIDLTPSVLEMFPNANWNWSIMPFNKNFTWEWVKRLPHKPWPWEEFPFHPDFVWRWVYETPESPWNWAALSHEITSCWQISHFSEKPWDWLVLTLNELATIRFIMTHRDFPWVIGELFFTTINEPNIQFLRTFRDRYNQVDWIDHTKHARWAIIKQNLDLPWSLTHIHWRPGELDANDMDFLIKNQQVLDMKKISEIVDYHGLVERAHGINWDLEGLSKNPTFSNYNLPEKIDGYNLNLVRVRDETHRWHASQTIQRYWKRAITDPKRKLCRDVFLKDMATLDSIRFQQRELHV
jgi:hypothetical protein